ncbi:hypothetical protein ZWY2020_000665 [Hordeum vulgare]|nr:hypothetical protein ZWY2020_000665 [Hordeum vulgare]
MSLTSSSSSVVRRQALALPLIRCAGCKEKVRMFVSTSEKHDGWVFYKCQNHGVNGNPVAYDDEMRMVANTWEQSSLDIMEELNLRTSLLSFAVGLLLLRPNHLKATGPTIPSAGPVYTLLPKLCT